MPITIRDMNEAQTSKELVEILQERMGEKEFMEVSTCPCDSYGWSKQTHAFMEKVQRQQLLPNCHVSGKLSFEVYDWTIVTK